MRLVTAALVQFILWLPLTVHEECLHHFSSYGFLAADKLHHANIKNSDDLEKDDKHWKGTSKQAERGEAVGPKTIGTIINPTRGGQDQDMRAENPGVVATPKIRPRERPIEPSQTPTSVVMLKV